MGDYIQMSDAELMRTSQRNRELLCGITISRLPVIPGDTYCNKDLEHWCKYLDVDYCQKYQTHLQTKSGIGYGFHAQKRCERCRKDYASGGDDMQLSICDLLAEYDILKQAEKRKYR